MASSALSQNVSSEAVLLQTFIHRKELNKAEENAKNAIREAVASSSSNTLGGLHAGKAFLAREENAAEDNIDDVPPAAGTDDSQASPEEASKEGLREVKTEENIEEAEDATAILNREETEAAAFEGLKDALKSTDKESSVDVKI